MQPGKAWAGTRAQSCLAQTFWALHRDHGYLQSKLASLQATASTSLRAGDVCLQERVQQQRKSLNSALTHPDLPLYFNTQLPPAQGPVLQNAYTVTSLDSESINRLGRTVSQLRGEQLCSGTPASYGIRGTLGRRKNQGAHLRGPRVQREHRPS